jgi:Protein of unknown function (DUF998)
LKADALVLALISLLGSLVYIGVVVALHFLPTGYDLIHNAVSDYGVGQYAPLFRVSLWAGSIAVLALAIGLAIEPGAPPLLTRGLVFLGLVSACRIGESMFPTTVEGQKLTRTGAMHYVFAILTFGFTYAGISDLTPDLVKLYPWHAHRGALDWLSGAILVGLILVLAALLPRLRHLFGLPERFFLAVTYIWLVVVAWLLAVLAH